MAEQWDGCIAEIKSLVTGLPICSQIYILTNGIHLSSTYNRATRFFPWIVAEADKSVPPRTVLEDIAYKRKEDFRAGNFREHEDITQTMNRALVNIPRFCGVNWFEQRHARPYRSFNEQLYRKMKHT